MEKIKFNKGGFGGIGIITLILLVAVCLNALLATVEPVIAIFFGGLATVPIAVAETFCVKKTVDAIEGGDENENIN